MSVDVGKARQVFFGKSPLTKELTRGAFGVSTKLTMDQVRDAAAITCREYPVKKRFMQSMAPRIVQRKSTASDVRWELALGAGLPGYAYAIILARYTETSG